MSRSKDVSRELTEVRTVHSRALSAIGRLDFLVEQRRGVDAWCYGDPDPDFDEMRAALAKVVESLERWRRH
jgi:hypothetical protein